ncbi:MAG: PDZ domain-containing protein, partial [Symploca sp. SIO2G7]|nr:PDZ domain-containing protein [Symploca sp. SIO2G7]
TTSEISNFYQVGGSLPANAPSYVERQADKEFYQQLSKGEFCYVLNSRQMGKSSLRKHTMRKLKSKGFVCAAVDLTGIGRGEAVTSEQWYAGIVNAIVESCDLDDKIDWMTWWDKRERFSPVERLRLFVDDMLLTEATQQVVIFVDEIDGVLSQNFSLDDFFALIRFFYDHRGDKPAYERLTFALLGVASPHDLINDKSCTPFNIGSGIELQGFRLDDEITPLINGLNRVVSDSDKTIKEILGWTGGQPFLTQKLCQLVVREANGGKLSIDELVETHIINNWESQDEPEHLRTIQDRVLGNKKQHTGRLLELYRQILRDGSIKADNIPEQKELRLSGLVVKRDGELKVFNRVYESVFNHKWIDEGFEKLRPYSKKMTAWENSHRSNSSFLLRGKELQKAQEWSAGKSLSTQDYKYLDESQKFHASKIIKRAGWISAAILFTSFAAAAGATLQAINAQKQREEAILATRIERSGNRALRLFESGQEIEALLLAMQSGLELKEIVNKYSSLQEYSSVTPLFTLQSILDQIKERNQLSPLPENINVEAVFSPDNQFLATPLEDGTVRLWNSSGQPLAKFKGDKVIFSPDSKHLATQSLDGIIRVWNISSKQKVTEFVAFWRDEIAIKFSADSLNIAAPLRIGDGLGFWNLSGEKIKEFPNSDINNLKFSPDGRYIALENSVLRRKDFSKCHQIKNVSQVEFSPDSKHIISYSRNSNKIELWNTLCQKIQQFEGTQAQFSPDGQYLVTRRNIDNKNIIMLWDLSGKQLAKIHRNTISEEKIVEFSPDSRYFAVSLDKFTGVETWKISEQQAVKTKILDTSGQGFFRVKFSQDGKYVAISHNNRQLKIWSLPQQQFIQELEGNIVFFSNDNRYLIIENYGKVQLFDISGSSLQEELKGNRIFFQSLKISHDSNNIVTDYEHGNLRFWNLFGQQIIEVKSELQPFFSEYNETIKFSPDGNFFVTFSNDGTPPGVPTTIELWNTLGKRIIEFRNLSHSNGAVFSPDNEHLAIHSYDQIYLFNLSSKKLKKFDLEGNNLQFTPDGKNFVTISSGGYQSVAKVQRWNLSGQLLAESEIQFMSSDSSKSLQHLEISPNAKYFAASVGGNKIGLWDLSGRRLKNFDGDTVKFSPDGQHLVTHSINNNKYILWNVSGQQLKEFEKSSNNPSISFSTNGENIALLLDQKRIVIWNLQKQQMTKIRADLGELTTIKFSPDGERLITESNTVIYYYDTSETITQIFDLSGRKLAEFDGHSAGFSPDGKVLGVAKANKVNLWHVGGLDELLTRGCAWLKYYLINNPEELEKLEICQDSARKKEAAQAFVIQGERLARQGEGKQAIAKFQKAKEWNPDLNFAPEVRTNQILAKAKQAEKAMQELSKGQELAKEGKIPEAIAAYTAAQQIDPNIIGANAWKTLCGYGSQNGYLNQVRYACEEARKLEPEYTPRVSIGIQIATDSNQKVVVKGTLPNSPAQKAGLKANDVILQVDGQSVSTAGDVIKIIANHQVGDIVPIEFERQGQKQTVEVKTTEIFLH